MQFPSDHGYGSSGGYPPNSGYYQTNTGYPPTSYGGGYDTGYPPTSGYPPSDPSYPPAATAYGAGYPDSSGYPPNTGYVDPYATNPGAGYPPSTVTNPYATNPGAGYPPTTGYVDPYASNPNAGYPPSTPVTNPYGTNPGVGYPPATSSPYATNPNAGYPPTTGVTNPYGTNPSAGYPPATPPTNIYGTNPAAGYPPTTSSPYATNPSSAYSTNPTSPYSTNPTSPYSTNSTPGYPPGFITTSDPYAVAVHTVNQYPPSPSPTHTPREPVDTARLEEEIRQKIKEEEKQKDEAKRLEVEELQRQHEEAKQLIEQQKKLLQDAKRKEEEQAKQPPPQQPQQTAIAPPPVAEEKSPRLTSADRLTSSDADSKRKLAKRTKSAKNNRFSDLVDASADMEPVEDSIVSSGASSSSKDRKADSGKPKKSGLKSDEHQKSLVTTFTELSKFDLISWKKDDYYTKKIPASSKEFKRFQALMNTMFNFDPLIIDELIAVYNPTLTSSFQNFQKTLATRKKDNPEIFFARKWQAATNQKLAHSQWINDEYEKRCALFKWNGGADLPILPVLHGTGLPIAEKICKTGFAAISALDAGYYGKGIYFSSHGLYTIPYLCFHREPAILFCYALPGNIYPVHENKDQKDSLLGQALQSGYQSHYVLTQRNGLISNPDGKEVFDELVLNQEAQVVPAYLIKISRSNIKQLKEVWNRSTN